MAYLGINAEDWMKYYPDLICANVKVAVKDKSKIKVVWTEDRVLEPKEI
jgi:hypothetical protein